MGPDFKFCNLVERHKMKNLLILCTTLILIIAVNGCTLQFKGEKVEIDGHIQKSYELKNFAWTKIEK